MRGRFRLGPLLGPAVAGIVGGIVFGSILLLLEPPTGIHFWAPVALASVVSLGAAFGSRFLAARHPDGSGNGTASGRQTVPAGGRAPVRTYRIS